MHSPALLVVVCAAVVLAGGCSQQATQQSPVVTLAANEDGTPQFDYSGPGKFNFRQSFESFSFEIGPLTGKPWVTAKGEMTFSDSNHMVMTLQSSSERPYEIELLGVCTNRTSDIPEEKAKERVLVGSGDQKVSIERFVIWTYDFIKEKKG